MEKIKIAICDDFPELCQYYQSLIDKQSDMTFVGYSYNSTDCRKLVEKEKPHILLLDIQLETIDAGIKLVPVIKQLVPDTKIIILTVHDQEDYVFDALVEGAEDFLLKTTDDEHILSTIRAIHKHEHKIDSQLVKNLLNVCATFKHQQASMLYVVNTFTTLSNTELSILRDIYNGMSYKELAASRFVEETTIRAHVSRILKKFNQKTMRSLIKSLKSLNVFELFKE